MTDRRWRRLLDFFDAPPQPLIGVDLGPTSIKCVELSMARSGEIVLEGYVIEPSPKDSFNDQGIANPDILGAALARAWKRLGTKTRRIAIAIPASAAITKKVRMSNNLDELAMAEETQSEAASFLTFPIEDVFVDWVVLGPHPSHPEADNEVLVCASRNDRIQDYLSMAEAAGLEAAVVDIDAFAQQRAFEMLISPGISPSSITAVAETGYSSMSISIHGREALLFHKEIHFGESHLIEAISQTYGVSRSQAEDFKNLHGHSLAEYSTLALRPFLARLGLEIDRAIKLAVAQGATKKVDKILLSGSCCFFDEAAKAIEDCSGISTSHANPLAMLPQSARMKKTAEEADGSALMAACGLALRKFDSRKT